MVPTSVTTPTFRFDADAAGDADADAILKMLAERLTGLGEAAEVFRVGGDSFALLFPKFAGAPQAIGNALVEACGKPYKLANREVFAPCSIGLALGAQSEDPFALIKNAELAILAAKWQGGACARLYSAELETLAPGDSVALESELRNALSGGQLDVFYQPIIRLSDRGMDFDAPAVDLGDLDPVESDRVGPVRRARREHAGGRSRGVAARMDDERVAVRAIEPGEEEQLIARRDPPQALEHLRLEDEPRVRRPLVALLGRRLQVVQWRLDAADRADVIGLIGGHPGSLGGRAPRPESAPDRPGEAEDQRAEGSRQTRRALARCIGRRQPGFGELSTSELVAFRDLLRRIGAES
jgi:GGDEF domain-containing protein